MHANLAGGSVIAIHFSVITKRACSRISTGFMFYSLLRFFGKQFYNLFFLTYIVGMNFFIPFLIFEEILLTQLSAGERSLPIHREYYSFYNRECGLQQQRHTYQMPNGRNVFSATAHVAVRYQRPGEICLILRAINQEIKMGNYYCYYSKGVKFSTYILAECDCFTPLKRRTCKRR